MLRSRQSSKPRFDATGANKRDATESAYDNYLDEYNRADQQRKQKVEARLDALERNKQRTLEDYHKSSLLEIPFP
jgi:hypothetical protein